MVFLQPFCRLWRGLVEFTGDIDLHRCREFFRTTLHCGVHFFHCLYNEKNFKLNVTELPYNFFTSDFIQFGWINWNLHIITICRLLRGFLMEFHIGLGVQLVQKPIDCLIGVVWENFKDVFFNTFLYRKASLKKS